MTITIPKFTAALSLVLGAGACATEETDPAADVEFRGTTFGSCNSGCPTNSPHANGYDVPELNLNGLANLDGVTLVGFVDATNNHYDLSSEDDELIALDAMGNNWKAGSQLIGWRIELTDAQNDTEYIHILDYTSAIETWTDNPQLMTAYAMAYTDPVTGRLVSICPDSYNDPYAKVVTVITGERYDGVTKTVKIGANEDQWITLACAGHAVYKMKRLEYGPNNGSSTAGQRNATLKMITAMYCGHQGDNKSYTTDNTPILWADADDTVNEQQAGAQLEAIWDAQGAVCWNTTRTTNIPDCPKDPCSAADVGEWTTWLPL